MNKRQPIVPDDPDLQGATAALKRAARHARELAQRTGTPCWVMRNGRIVDAVTGREAPRKIGLASLEENPAPEVDAAWDGEIRKRIAEVESGTVKLVPADEVFARVRRALS